MEELNPSLNDLELEKKILEIEKVKLENKELRKMWYTKPSLIIPILISILTLSYGFITGFFDSKYQEYKANKSILELQQINFANTRDSISNQINKYQDSLTLAADSLKFINDKLNQTTLDLEDYKKQLTEIKMITKATLDNLAARDSVVANLIKQNTSMGNSYSFQTRNLSIRMQSLQMENLTLTKKLEKCEENNLNK